MLRKTKWSSISLAQLLKGRHIGCNSPDGPWKSCQTYSDVVGMSTIRGNTMSSASMALWELKQSKMRYSLVDVLLSYAATDLSQKRGCAGLRKGCQECWSWCLGRLQWNSLCLWSNWLRKDIHCHRRSGKICGPWYHSKVHITGVW